MEKQFNWVAVGGTTTAATTLLPSAAYDNAAVLLLIEGNGTVILSSIVAYTFGDGTKVNGVTSISL